MTLSVMPLALLKTNTSYYQLFIPTLKLNETINVGYVEMSTKKILELDV